MSRARALLGRDVKREQQDIQRKAAKQDLWSSIGSTVGTLALTGLTGGVVNPLTAGLLTGAGSLIGGAIGSKAAENKYGNIRGGKFFQSDRKELSDQLGAFGSKNVTRALKSGMQAGFGKAKSLAKTGTTDIGSLTPTASNLPSSANISGGIPGLQGGTPLVDGSIPDTGVSGMDRVQGFIGPVSPQSTISPSNIRRTGGMDSFSQINKVEVPQVQIPTAIGGGALSRSEQSVYDTTNRIIDQGYDVDMHGRISEEFGNAYINKKGDITQFHQGRPDVPLDLSGIEDDEFGDMFLSEEELLERDVINAMDINRAGYSDRKLNTAISALQNYRPQAETGFPQFDESSWAENQAKLDAIDAQMLNEMESGSRYYNTNNSAGSSVRNLYNKKW